MFSFSRPRAWSAIVAVAASTAACALPHAELRGDAGADIVMVDADATLDADTGVGPACDAGVLCSGRCTLTDTDPNNCGSCGFVCRLQHATTGCAMGACAIATCEAGWGDCNGDPTDGCEAPLNSLENCNGCGQPCVATANATASCSTGACVRTCARNYDDCDSDPANGCESITTVENCGMCGRRCSGGTPFCDATSGCVSGCGALPNCNGMCTDTTSSPQHCGACNMACPSRANATAVCASSACGFTCNAGFGDCDGNASNGCETNLLTSVAHCGRCGAAATAPANATATCTAGVAGFRCNANFGDCDGNASNGCEVNLTTATGNCGACGRVCTGATNATAVCASSTCSFTCTAGFGNCDGNASNGCEVNLTNTVSNCGACGTSCPSAANATPTCASSACGIACNTGFQNCDSNAGNGCEINITNNTSNCGGCGVACTRNNAAPACAASVCSIGTCNAGFGDCDGTDSNGCETNTNSSTSHCGACGMVCSRPNAAASCTTGSCTLGACNMGFGNCDGNAVNGCETNTTNTLAHCGACGAACSRPNAAASCAASTCTLGACNTGFANCDGNAMNGCEANTDTSSAHCGGCGMACVTGASCAGGACVCAMGSTACGGTAGRPLDCCSNATETCNAGVCVTSMADAGSDAGGDASDDSDDGG